MWKAQIIYINPGKEAAIDIVYFEEIVVGEQTMEGQHQTDKDEILEFARKWDRQPFHVDEEAAKSYPYGGLIAPAPYLLAVVTRVVTSPGVPKLAVIGLLEYERVRILKPVHPGDILTVIQEPVEKRELKSKPDRGIVRYHTQLKNQNDEVVLSYFASCMIAKKPK